MKGFLYGQTEYNLLRNSIHLKDYVEFAQQHSFTFLSMTDRNLYGCYKFYRLCLEHHLKPIIGLEIVYEDPDGLDSVLLGYALNEIGYRELLKISTYLNTHRKPVGMDFLDSFKKENIAWIVVWDQSILSRGWQSREIDLFTKHLNTLRQLPHFYIGYSLTNHSEKTEHLEIRKYCEEKKIPCLPIHQSCYLKEEDRVVFRALTQIGSEEWPMTERDHYEFLTEPPMTAELEHLIDQIHLELFQQKISLPKYPHTKGVPSFQFLSALCQKGLVRRCHGKVEPAYQKRLDYELSVIHKMNYDDYFLIVWDFILYAKKKSILVGPGRGTAAGSLVAYCLGITEIDPICHDLLFERFLNPERVSMPDIDTDFPDNRRDEMIQYVQSVYGEKHVCTISAFNTFSLKSSVRDLGRIMKMESDRLDEMVHLLETASDFSELLKQFADRPDVSEFLYIIQKLDGLPRHVSTHAAGVIISDRELDDMIPLQEGLNGLYQSQFEASDLEKIGLLKMDFLGIRNLTVLSNIIDALPDWDIAKLRKLPLDDPLTYRLLQRADTLGIFQLESEGIRKVLRNLKPEKFEDLVVVLALYRPGPMSNINEFIRRRHGGKFTYLHPSLEPILKNTYGIIVYQEQIMKIAQSLADFSLGEADLLRRAIKKKDSKQLLSIQPMFIERAVQQGYSAEVAQSVYDYIFQFADYGFNKSHSVAYALLAYEMAYFKAHYFNVFMSNILNNVIGATKVMYSYILYAREHGLETDPPDINRSSQIFEVGEHGLFLPFQAIRTIGETQSSLILQERQTNGNFKSFRDFKKRCPSINSSSLEALIYSGAFDGFGQTKKELLDLKESYSEIFLNHLDDQIEDHSELDVSVLREKEFSYLGFNLKYNPFRSVGNLYAKYHALDLIKIRNNGNFRVIGMFKQTKILTTKNNETMMVGVIQDRFSEMEFVIFPATYQTLQNKISTRNLYVIDGKTETDAKTRRLKLVIQQVNQIE